ncbi:MAG: flagellar hook-associated protein FlgK [Sporolactobacillus sp.]
MIPIFSSLNMMQRALEANQEVIQTTGNNISNANTDGYSRQRVDLTTWYAYPAAGINASKGAGQVGTGVNAGSITRIRDQFVDAQVRDNANQNGYWSAVNDAYSQMESIVNETSSDSGVANTLDTFWQSLQDLASNAGTSGTGSTVLEDGSAVTDTFNYMASSLNKIQTNIGQQITENTTLVNSYADQINSLNQEINTQEANGMLPNDLYDQRDALVDKLSALVNVKVTTTKSGGNPSSLAEGLYTIQLVDANGNPYKNDSNGENATLVDSKTFTDNHLSAPLSTDANGNATVTQSLVSADGTTPVVSTLTNMYGTLQGEVDAYTTDYPEVMKSLNNMASTLATNFNTAYAASAGGAAKAQAFFLGNGSGNSAGTVTALNIHVNSNLSGSDITANANGAVSGDNSAATAMADVIATNKYSVDGGSSTPSTLEDYLSGLVGQIGVNAQSADQLSTNTSTLLTSAQNQRASISGVSVDEELTNLIQYQQAYSASAKVVTTLNTMLDTLINRMGE